MGTESVEVSTTLYDHIQRMNNVMNYIHNHLAETLSVSLLARQANYSIYHFQRVFRGITGDNVNDFITRLRIQKARKMLLFQHRLSITTILTECGFASSASFARKFTQLLGMTSSEYRIQFNLERSTFPEVLIQELNKLDVVGHIRELSSHFVRFPNPCSNVTHFMNNQSGLD